MFSRQQNPIYCHDATSLSFLLCPFRDIVVHSPVLHESSSTLEERSIPLCKVQRHETIPPTCKLILFTLGRSWHPSRRSWEALGTSLYVLRSVSGSYGLSSHFYVFSGCSAGPVTPDAVNDLVRAGVQVLVQPCDRRIWTNEEFVKVGALALVAFRVISD